MSSLFKNLRVHQIFGANTDVGKTILTTALARASAAKRNPVFYLKPISTGPIEDADDLHVKRFGGDFAKSIKSECIFRYKEPVSPHLAARLLSKGDESEIPSDKTVVNSIANRLKAYATSIDTYAHAYVETAGGIHSPSLSGTPQADCYRPLFLPTILIGDSKLGGISSTISAYESLLLRGYIIDAVLIFRDEYYRNWEYLQPYFAERGVRVSVADAPPERLPDLSENFRITDQYYNVLVASTETNGLADVVSYLDDCHSQRLDNLKTMPKRTLDTIWWPFVQHQAVTGEKDVTVIDSAYGDFFSVYHNSSVSDQLKTKESVLLPEFDGSASWWTQTVGHSNPSLALAAAKASGRYGHVMFPRATHMPALKLAERLVHDGPGKGWASRAFFSDNGSTGMEVALKMALRAYSSRNSEKLDPASKKSLGVLGLKGSYHGDTIGAMDACEEGVYTCEWHNAKGYWFEPPSIGIKNGTVSIHVPPAVSATPKANTVTAKSLSWVYDIEERLRTPLARVYALYIERTLTTLERKGGPKLAALIIEPLVMGAGGMIFVDPLFQRVLVDIVRGRRSGKSTNWSGMPVIFDEVFVGLYRIGMESTGPLLGVHPDISVNAKVLTGGLVPLAVTLTSKSIFEAFLSDNKADALLHGHSYTAHAVGCEVANETLKMIDNMQTSEKWSKAQSNWQQTDGSPSTVWSFWDSQFTYALSKLPIVEEVMTLGCVLSIKLRDDRGGYTSSSAQELFQPLSRWLESPDLSVAPGGAPFNIHFRTLGDVAYFMTSLNTSPEVIRSVEDRIWSTIA